MNYFTLEYKKVCRDCIGSDGLENIFSIMGDEQTYLRFSEFELSEEILQKSQENEIQCSNCGSDNFQIYNTKVNINNQIHQSYDFEREAYNRNFELFYMITSSKKNGIISFKEGGRNNTLEFQKKGVIQLLKKTLESKPNSIFKACHKGDFSFVASAKFSDDPDDYKLYYKIEEFFHTGFSKEEISDLINRNSQYFEINGF